MQLRSMFEPGIIKTFRLFVGARLALVIFSLLIYLLGAVRRQTFDGWATAFILLDVVLLLGYLSVPRLERFLKKAYLPIGILWATVGPLLALQMIFYWLLHTAQERSAFLLMLQSILVLFIPLIIIGWRYSMREVVGFCGLTFLFDILLVFAFFPDAGNLYISPILGMSLVRAVTFLMVGYLVTHLVKEQREQHQRLVEANDRLAHYAATLEQLTISRERNRVARELHDVLAHTMSGVAVELEGVRAMLRVDPEHAEALLGQSLRAVREGLSETRRALQALRASPLEDLGLGLAIQNLAESIAGRAGLQTDVQVDTEVSDYPIEVQQSFYRVTQEALTNVISHAQASRVQICLLREGPALKLFIRDNGIGFDDKTINLDQKYGLLGIRERVEMIHGSLSIVSQVGAGTEILLTYEASPTEVAHG